jgi:hypothetical protein
MGTQMRGAFGEQHRLLRPGQNWHQDRRRHQGLLNQVKRII